MAALLSTVWGTTSERNLVVGTPAIVAMMAELGASTRF
jgi:hypothetical protein